MKNLKTVQACGNSTRRLERNPLYLHQEVPDHILQVLLADAVAKFFFVSIESVTFIITKIKKNVYIAGSVNFCFCGKFEDMWIFINV